jgi:septal ring factor EnvC (AmiA/AmiB activator)
MRDYCSNLDSENDEQALEIEELKKENKKLRETIKDHQLYEKKLEHRIIEFEELLH